jgi:hypothetical protein
LKQEFRLLFGHLKNLIVEKLSDIPLFLLLVFALILLSVALARTGIKED